ncbi:hypothetical protein llap_4208 [Limosa lapponica baueri]|uniref:Uncharacterized protein n=1 Tax=Limosa lapponica baueri TaxID=1758121 RepID=A0A2I0UHF5_LIMLA|nr:hypothetical protein llap_4208 [Limosa lapponica baueri]
MALVVALGEEELKEQSTKSIIGQDGGKSKDNMLRVVEDIKTQLQAVTTAQMPRTEAFLVQSPLLCFLFDYNCNPFSDRPSDLLPVVAIKANTWAMEKLKFTPCSPCLFHYPGWGVTGTAASAPLPATASSLHLWTSELITSNYQANFVTCNEKQSKTQTSETKLGDKSVSSHHQSNLNQL